jgi:hypothetical protein
LLHWREITWQTSCRANMFCRVIYPGARHSVYGVPFIVFAKKKTTFFDLPSVTRNGLTRIFFLKRRGRRQRPLLLRAASGLCANILTTFYWQQNDFKKKNCAPRHVMCISCKKKIINIDFTKSLFYLNFIYFLKWWS